MHIEYRLKYKTKCAVLVDNRSFSFMSLVLLSVVCITDNSCKEKWQIYQCLAIPQSLNLKASEFFLWGPQQGSSGLVPLPQTLKIL
jgi:hypothetical protein